jgi:hypothetical protein
MVSGIAALSPRKQAFAIRLLLEFGFEGSNRDKWLPELINSCWETDFWRGIRDRFVMRIGQIDRNLWSQVFSQENIEQFPFRLPLGSA